MQHVRSAPAPPSPVEAELVTPCPHCYGFVEDHARDGHPRGDCRAAPVRRRPGDDGAPWLAAAERVTRAAARAATTPLERVLAGGLAAAVHVVAARERACAGGGKRVDLEPRTTKKRPAVR